MMFLFSEKHGTCSAPVVQDELQYFTMALDFYFKYNVTVSTQVSYADLSYHNIGFFGRLKHLCVASMALAKLLLQIWQRTLSVLYY